MADVEIRPATMVEEFIGIAEVVEPGFIAIVFRDVAGLTYSMPISRAEAIRLTRGLLASLGPQETLPPEDRRSVDVRTRDTKQ